MWDMAASSGGVGGEQGGHGVVDGEDLVLGAHVDHAWLVAREDVIVQIPRKDRKRRPRVVTSTTNAD